MITDPWTYRRDVDLSRLRMAAAMVEWLVPDGLVELCEDGVVQVEFPKPLVDFFGIRKSSKARGVTALCARLVPTICGGWCPELRFAWVK